MPAVTLARLEKAPFPWFGGKTDAAPFVWTALGDCDHYVEPFMGSLATLLLRPHKANRAYYSETVNDLDGLLCNAWRSIQLSTDATAEAASWPVCEADLHARHVALVRWKANQPLERLMGDPAFHDPVMAGWWIWGQSSWIGSGWCSGKGGWSGDADGIFRRQKGEPVVSRQLPHLGDDGRGVNHAGAREPGVTNEREFHPMTMPEVRRWFAFLSARLRHVRILNGDWKRAVTSGASKTLSVRMGDGVAGIFLDPPYSGEVRVKDLYAHDSNDVAAEVLAWCKKNGPDPKLRIVLAGFANEAHVELEREGWTAVEWFKSGFLKGGMANTAGDDDESGEVRHQQGLERLWLSPACLRPETAQQCRLFGCSS